MQWFWIQTNTWFHCLNPSMRTKINKLVDIMDLLQH